MTVTAKDTDSITMVAGSGIGISDPTLTQQAFSVQLTVNFTRLEAPAVVAHQASGAIFLDSNNQAAAVKG